MKKNEIFEETLFYLKQIRDLSSKELHMMLASMMMYHESSIRNESWNVFRSQIEKKKIPIHTAIFMTDEEKLPSIFNNPDFSKKNKADILYFLYCEQQKLFEKYEKKQIYLTAMTENRIVVIPDLVKPQSEEPTIYPYQYLKNQIESGNLINELTGQQFPYEIIEMIRKNLDPVSFTFHLEHTKKISNDLFLKLLGKELVRLDKLVKQCYICNKKQTHFKTLQRDRFIRFCSLDCLNKHEH